MIESVPLDRRMERYISIKPLRSARLLRDLEDQLSRRPDDVFVKERRDALLRGFRALGRCENCGKEITSGESLERRVGPVCAKRIAEAQRRREAMA